MEGETSTTLNLPRVEHVDACPLCHGKRFRHFATSHDRLYLLDRRSFDYKRCCDCGVIFQATRPIEADIARYYPSDYGPYGGRKGKAAARAPGLVRAIRKEADRIGKLVHGLLRTVTADRYEKKYRAIYDRPSKDPSLLDFGCGSDSFLNKARTWGWRTTGVDFSPLAVDQAMASGHEACLLGSERWQRMDRQSFDLIRLSHVWEHLYDPKQVLRSLHERLKPGGTMHLAVPNPGSLSARVFGRFWFSLDCPRHIMLYTPQRGRALLEECGFEDVRVLHEPVTKDMARSFVYALHAAGVVPHGWVETVIKSRAIDTLLYVPVRLAAALKCGERIHFVCRKPMAAVAGVRPAAEPLCERPLAVA